MSQLHVAGLVEIHFALHCYIHWTRALGDMGACTFHLGCNSPFPILIKTTLIINNESGTLKIPHEHFERGCTNLKRSQTIMN